MPRGSGPQQEEREPLIAEGASVQPAAAREPQPCGDSGGASGDGTGARLAADTAVAAATQVQRATAAQVSCRICLQDEEAGLVKPCNCSGSMAWAHHECIQRWIDEKHDTTCEVCQQQFQGRFREPPPRPAPAPLVAQLQIDNADNRIVLLADPETGAIVARVVVPPSGELGEEEGADGWWVGEEAEAQGCGVTVCSIAAIVLVCLLVAFAWFSAAADAGGGEAAVGAGAWMVRIVLLTAWICLRTMRPVCRPTRRHAASDVDEVRQRFTDLEAGRQ